MILCASAGISARDAQAGENRGGIAAHKYAGLTSFQRTIPRMRKDCGVAAVCGDLTHAKQYSDVRNESKETR